MGKSTNWIKHVMTYAKQHKIKFGEALSQARKTYKGGDGAGEEGADADAGAGEDAGNGDKKNETPEGERNGASGKMEEEPPKTAGGRRKRRQSQRSQRRQRSQSGGKKRRCTKRRQRRA